MDVEHKAVSFIREAVGAEQRKLRMVKMVLGLEGQAMTFRQIATVFSVSITTVRNDLRKSFWQMGRRREGIPSKEKMETLLFIAGLIEKLPCRNSRIFERFVETVRRQEALHTYVDTNGFTERTRRIREQLSVGTNLFTEEDVEAWVVNVTQLVRQDETFTITLDSIPD